MKTDKLLRAANGRASKSAGRESGSSLALTQRLTARGIGIVLGAVALATVLGGFNRSPLHGGIYSGTVALASREALEGALDSTNVLLEGARQELQRAQSLIQYSARFNIPADLAASIHDIAVEVGLEPELAYRVVFVESNFNPKAVSSAGAIGLAQVMHATAQFYQHDIRPEDLFDPETNLTIGFQYLRDLIKSFDGDLQLALIAYNRGPARLRDLLRIGVDPRNGYASTVLEGYEIAMESPALQ